MHRRSTSLGIGEINGYNNNNFKNPENNKVGKDVEKLEPSHTAGGNVKWCSCLGKQSSSSPEGSTVTMWLSNSTPRYTPQKMKAYIHAKTSTQMLTAALFKMAKKQTQPRRPSTAEQVSKYGLSMHQNVIRHWKEWSAHSWIRLKNTTLSQRSA